jgi:hypothetical protein
MDSRRFNMIYGGQFDKAEGLVYDVFDEELHVVDPFQLPPDTKYYAGIDWGYRDPFVISVRAVTPLGMHYRVAEFCYPQKTMSEMIEAGWRFKKLFNIIAFYADPSRPDYINEFCRAGLTTIAAQNDIRIGIDSHYELIKEGRYQVFRNTSPYLLDEYSQYHYPEIKDLKPDQSTKDELPVDQNNHCIAEGTLILTDRGLVPIEQVTINDKVRTRGKFNRVISSGISGFNRDIVEVKTSTGHSVLCTPDHKIWTSNGFIRADTLRYGDILLTIGDTEEWKSKKQIGMDPHITDTRCLPEERTGYILRKLRNICIGKSGFFIMGKFQKAFIFIISTVILVTIQLIILPWLVLKNILALCNGQTSKLKKEKIIWKKSDHYLRPGIVLRKVWNSTGKMARKHARSLHPRLRHVFAVVRNFSPKDCLVTTNSVTTIVSQNGEGQQESTILKRFARYVKKNSRQTSMLEQKLAHSHVVGVYPAGQGERVYDLTVAVEHEFFANGILVHNCCDSERYVTMATYKRYGHKPNRIHLHSDVYDLSKTSKSVYYDSEHSKLYKPSKKKNNHIL